MTTNQLTANCNTCTYLQAARDRAGTPRAADPPCSCVPAAEINAGGASACVVADVASGRGDAGRVFRFEFTATAPTGKSCSGVAKLCVGGRAAVRSGYDNTAGGGAVQETDDSVSIGRNGAASAALRSFASLAGSVGGVGAQCVSVARSRGGVGVRGGIVGVQCLAQPSSLMCRDDYVEYNALVVRLYLVCAPSLL